MASQKSLAFLKHCSVCLIQFQFNSMSDMSSYDSHGPSTCWESLKSIIWRNLLEHFPQKILNIVNYLKKDISVDHF